MVRAALSFDILSEKAEQFRQSVLNQSVLNKHQTQTYTSPYTECLFAVLRTLKWPGATRQFLESLPHFVDDIDFIDLRNTLANLGYETNAIKLNLETIKEFYLPALWLSPENNLFFLYQDEAEELFCFDPETKTTQPLSPTHKLSGTLYLISKIDQPLTQKIRSNNWFLDTILRFKHTIFTLISLSFFINLLSLITPVFILLIYDNVIGKSANDMLPPLILGALLILTAEASLRLFKSRIIAYIGGRLDYILGVNALQQILLLPISFIEKAPLSGQISRLKEFESIREFFVTPLASILFDVPFIFVFIIAIAILGGWLAFIPITMLACFTLLGVILLPKLKRRIQHANKARSKKQTIILETFTGLHSIKHLHLQKQWLKKCKYLIAESSYNTYLASNVSGLLQNISQLIMFMSGVSFMAFGAVMVANGTLSIGALIAIMAIGWRILAPLQTGFYTITKIDQIINGIKQLNQLMRFQTEFDPYQKPYTTRVFSGQINFNRVSYRYHLQSEAALLGINFDIKPHEIVAVIGPNGAGKSTLLKLAAGILTPQTGQILYDKLDIRQIYPPEIRTQIGYLPQNAQLFYGTIAQNLLIAAPEADDEALMRAVNMAGLSEIIAQLPEQLQTRLHDNSMFHNSAGFSQKMGLARVYLRKPKLLILDEPGSNMDYAGDQLLIKNLETLKQDATILIATHRPSHMRMADKLIVMHQGQIEFMGSPQEVMPKIPQWLM